MFFFQRRSTFRLYIIRFNGQSNIFRNLLVFVISRGLLLMTSHNAKRNWKGLRVLLMYVSLYNLREISKIFSIIHTFSMLLRTFFFLKLNEQFEVEAFLNCEAKMAVAFVYWKYKPTSLKSKLNILLCNHRLTLLFNIYFLLCSKQNLFSLLLYYCFYNKYSL